MTTTPPLPRFRKRLPNGEQPKRTIDGFAEETVACAVRAGIGNVEADVQIGGRLYQSASGALFGEVGGDGTIFDAMLGCQPLTQRIERFLPTRDQHQMDAHGGQLFRIAGAGAFGRARDDGPGTIFVGESSAVKGRKVDFAHRVQVLSWCRPYRRGLRLRRP
jgi:hypothetical protein